MHIFTQSYTNPVKSRASGTLTRLSVQNVCEEFQGFCNGIMQKARIRTMSETDLKKVYGMFTDCWRLFKKFNDIQLTDEYWEAVTSDGDQLARQYGNGRFIRDLTLAVIMELERWGKGGKNHGAKIIL